MFDNWSQSVTQHLCSSSKSGEQDSISLPVFQLFQFEGTEVHGDTCVLGFILDYMINEGAPTDDRIVNLPWPGAFR